MRDLRLGFLKRKLMRKLRSREGKGMGGSNSKWRGNITGRGNRKTYLKTTTMKGKDHTKRPSRNQNPITNVSNPPTSQNPNVSNHNKSP